MFECSCDAPKKLSQTFWFRSNVHLIPNSCLNVFESFQTIRWCPKPLYWVFYFKLNKQMCLCWPKFFILNVSHVISTCKHSCDVPQKTCLKCLIQIKHAYDAQKHCVISGTLYRVFHFKLNDQIKWIQFKHLIIYIIAKNTKIFSV